MNPASSRQPYQLSAKNSRMKQMERKEWWLWSFVVVITILLTAGIASFALPLLHDTDSFYGFQIRQSAWGLLGLVLLFDIYSLYQQFQIQSVRRQLVARDELFRVISENAADMIAVVDQKANRIYNSPAYERVLGYSAQELQTTSAMDQVHPDDRAGARLGERYGVEVHETGGRESGSNTECVTKMAVGAPLNRPPAQCKMRMESRPI